MILKKKQSYEVDATPLSNKMMLNEYVQHLLKSDISRCNVTCNVRVNTH